MRLALVLLLSVVAASGCAGGPKPRWRAGILPVETAPARPARRPADVALTFKQEFGLLEETQARRGFSADSVTLLRRSELIPGRTDARPPGRRRVVLGELTTEELPRDDEKSRLDPPVFQRVFGLGPDDWSFYVVVPQRDSVELGVARLKELAAIVGADAVEEAFMTVYAEHQMWEGIAVSLDPRSTRSPIFARGRLLDFKLRDVRFHGLAVAYED